MYMYMYNIIIGRHANVNMLPKSVDLQYYMCM